MRNSTRIQVSIIVFVLLTAFAATAAELADKQSNIMGGPPPTPSSMFNAHCFAWKMGERTDFGTTWVSSSDAFIYTGAGLQFTPSKKTAPEDFTPSPDLAGVIAVGFSSPAYVPSSVEVAYSFLPVSRSSSSTLQPPPTRIGLTWFNDYGPGATDPAFEQTATVYPAAGAMNYPYHGWNNHTRYLVYVKTGDKGKGEDANDRGFAASGVICVNP